jgi:formiminotetrahydrofolate cyclodeaminase
VRAGQLAARIVEMAAELADSGNPSVLSDVAVASSAARAALEAAIVNIEINRREVKDREAAARLGAVIGELEAAIAPAGRVVGAVRERLRS